MLVATMPNIISNHLSREMNVLMEKGGSHLPMLKGIDLTRSESHLIVIAVLDRLESCEPCKDKASIWRTFRSAWSILAFYWIDYGRAFEALMNVMAEREDEARCADVDPSNLLNFISWLFPEPQFSPEDRLDEILSTVNSCGRVQAAWRLDNSLTENTVAVCHANLADCSANLYGNNDQLCDNLGTTVSLEASPAPLSAKASADVKDCASELHARFGDDSPLQVMRFFHNLMRCDLDAIYLCPCTYIRGCKNEFCDHLK